MEANRLSFGKLTARPVVTSRFRLDGGSMFGVVPRALWEKKAPPDERNRIELHANSLLLETGTTRILIDPGMGSRFDAREFDYYALERRGAREALLETGLSPADIDTVILTHLHFDHAGGCTTRGDSNGAVPVFTNARHIVQENEWRQAVDPHPLARSSYRPDDFMPLEDAGLVELVSGEMEVAPGVSVELTGGHTEGHQVVRIGPAGLEALYPGDEVPTAAHLRLNWLMSWDIDPRAAFEAKSRLLREAAEKETVVFWCHDPNVMAARVSPGAPSEYAVSEILAEFAQARPEE